jgi:hypothetical protein
MHVEASAKAYVPAVQFEHTVAATSEYLPPGHVAHAADTAEGSYLPLGQSIQVEASANANVPAVQFEHTVAFAPLVNRPVAHTWHVLPVDGWYFPGGQSVHADDSGTAYSPFSQVVHDTSFVTSASISPNSPTPIRPPKPSVPQNVFIVSLQYRAEGQESGMLTSFTGFGTVIAEAASSAVVHNAQVEPSDEVAISMSLASRALVSSWFWL